MARGGCVANTINLYLLFHMSSMFVVGLVSVGVCFVRLVYIL